MRLKGLHNEAVFGLIDLYHPIPFAERDGLVHHFHLHVAVEVVAFIWAGAGIVIHDVVGFDFTFAIGYQLVHFHPVVLKQFNHFCPGLGNDIGLGGLYLYRRHVMVVMADGFVPGSLAVVLDAILSGNRALEGVHVVSSERNLPVLGGVQAPVERKGVLDFDVVVCRFAHFQNPNVVRRCPLQQCPLKLKGALHPICKRLEHVGLRGKAQRIEQRGISGAVARGLHEVLDALEWCAPHAVDIWCHAPPPCFHALEHLWIRRITDEGAQLFRGLVRLGGDHGHGVLVIRTVTGVSIQKEVWPQGREQLLKRPRVVRIGLDEIAIQVQVAGVATEAILLGTVLIGTRTAAAVERAAYVVDRNDGHAHVV